MSRKEFKIWDKQENKWFEPIYMAYEGVVHELLLSPSGYLIRRNLNSTSHESLFPDRYEVVFSTGLKDKNGKKIYEGDIVKNNRYGGLAEVVWTNDVDCKIKEPVKGLFGEYTDLRGFITTLGQFEFKWPEGAKHKSYYVQDMEVVGNIYENSELLK